MSAISYKCPNCGGELTFDPKNQEYKCEYCFSHFAQEELEAANPAASAKSGEKKEKGPNGSSESESGEAVLYTCPSCGAEIVTDSTTAATFCYYCHNPVVLSGRVSGEFLPDQVIPFRIDRKKAQQDFIDYVHKKRFVPNAFFSQDQIEKLSGVYFPVWLFDARMKGHYQANGKKIRIWVSGDTEYTETREFAVERSGSMEFTDLSKNALKKANRTLVEGVWPYRLDEAKPFHMGYLSGFQAERRDMEAGEFETEVTGEFTEYGERLLKESVEQYDAVIPRDCHCRMEELRERYLLVPVWTLTYRGKDGKLYYYTMNGQTGKIVGKFPMDGKKMAILFFSVMLPVLILGLLGGYFI